MFLSSPFRLAVCFQLGETQELLATKNKSIWKLEQLDSCSNLVQWVGGVQWGWSLSAGPLHSRSSLCSHIVSSFLHPGQATFHRIQLTNGVRSSCSMNFFTRAWESIIINIYEIHCVRHCAEDSFLIWLSPRSVVGGNQDGLRELRN